MLRRSAKVKSLHQGSGMCNPRVARSAIMCLSSLDGNIPAGLESGPLSRETGDTRPAIEHAPSQNSWRRRSASPSTPRPYHASPRPCYRLNVYAGSSRLPTALSFLRSSRLPHPGQCVSCSPWVSLVSRSSKNIHSCLPPTHQTSPQILCSRSHGQSSAANGSSPSRLY